MWKNSHKIAKPDNGFLYWKSWLESGGELRLAQSGEKHMGTQEY